MCQRLDLTGNLLGRRVSLFSKKHQAMIRGVHVCNAKGQHFCLDGRTSGESYSDQSTFAATP